MVELVFSISQKTKITNIIQMPSPNLKNKFNSDEISIPRKIDLKLKLIL